MAVLRCATTRQVGSQGVFTSWLKPATDLYPTKNLFEMYKSYCQDYVKFMPPDGTEQTLTISPESFDSVCGDTDPAVDAIQVESDIGDNAVSFVS